MNVNACMSTHVRIASPSDPISHAAQIMKDIDSGILPVGENDRLIGMVTDRDIAIRGVADHKGPDTPVREVMTRDVQWCYDDEDLDAAERKMAALRVRRLPVLNREKRLVGMLSLGDLAKADDGAGAGEALGEIAKPGGPHSH